MKKIVSLSAFILILGFPLLAQQNYQQQIRTENVAVAKVSESTNISMEIDFSNLKIDKNHLIVVTPFVKANNGRELIELAPITIAGSRRNTILDRPFQWKGKAQLPENSYASLVRKNGTLQKVDYKVSISFDKWQRDASLSVKYKIIGCADCLTDGGSKTLQPKIISYEEFKPNYVMAYTVPEVEAVKQRSERYSAHFNYRVGKFDLLPDFGNNAAELVKVDRSIGELKKDADLTINELTVSGYASPEGSLQSNNLLSQRRAETFATYIQNKYGFNRGQIKVDWFGEDWRGLREAVVKSALPNKEAILSIIDDTPNEDARDAKIIALDNRATYNRLLEEFYAPLRRNDYNIAFISRPFNVDEAKAIIYVNPKKLSLNEMYLVANTYPENSSEFRKVFEIAANTFSNDVVANLNAAVSEIQDNKNDAAIARLQKLQENARAMSLMGMAYINKGDFKRALELLEKAEAKGDPDAIHNLNQLKLMLENEN